MKSAERHKLKENEVASLLTRILDWLMPRLTVILSVLGVILVLFVAYLIIHHNKVQKNIEAGRNIEMTMKDLGVTAIGSLDNEKVNVLENLAAEYSRTRNGAKLLFDIGKYYLNKGEDEKAAEYFMKSAENHMDRNLALVAAASAYQNSGEFGQAEAVLSEIKSGESSYENALYLRYIGALKTDNEELAEELAGKMKDLDLEGSVYKEMLNLREVL